MSEYRRIIAVDFDGTLAETKFPEIVAPKLRMIQCTEKARLHFDSVDMPLRKRSGSSVEVL